MTDVINNNSLYLVTQTRPISDQNVIPGTEKRTVATVAECLYGSSVVSRGLVLGKNEVTHPEMPTVKYDVFVTLYVPLHGTASGIGDFVKRLILGENDFVSHLTPQRSSGFWEKYADIDNHILQPDGGFKYTIASAINNNNASDQRAALAHTLRKEGLRNFSVTVSETNTLLVSGYSVPAGSN